MTKTSICKISDVTYLDIKSNTKRFIGDNIVNSKMKLEINKNIIKHLDGDLSYLDALTNSQNLYELSDYYDEETSILYIKKEINKEFENALEINQIMRAQDSLNNLLSQMVHLKILPNYNALELANIHTLLHQSLGDIYFENQRICLELANFNYQAGVCSIDICQYSKDGIIQSSKKFTCRMSKEQYDILYVEWLIFLDKNYGHDIEEWDCEIFSNSALILRSDYLEKKHQGQFDYKGACFSGGGAQGIGYAAIFKSWTNYRLDRLHAVSGTSAGSIIASMIATGMNSFDLKRFIITGNLKLRQHELCELVRKSMFTNIRNRLKDYNLQKSSQLTLEQRILYSKYIGIYGGGIDPNYDVTFADLAELKRVFPEILSFKKLVICACYLAEGKPMEVHLSEKTVPDMPISLAVICSSCLPVYFKPVDVTKYMTTDVRVRLGLPTKESQSKIRFIDGGVINNIPTVPLSGLLQDGNIATFMFENSRKLYVVEPNAFELLGNKILGIRWDAYSRGCVWEIEKHIGNQFYLNTGLSSINFGMASQKAWKIVGDISKKFIADEFTQKVKPSVFRSDRILNIFTHIIAPVWFSWGSKNSIEKDILNSKYNSTQSYFEVLSMTIDEDEFMSCYESYQSRLKMIYELGGSINKKRRFLKITNISNYFHKRFLPKKWFVHTRHRYSYSNLDNFTKKIKTNFSRKIKFATWFMDKKNATN